MNDAKNKAERYLAIWNETDALAAAPSSPRAGRKQPHMSIR